MKKCGDANPNGNIMLTSKGGCRELVRTKDAYRCTGCGVYFHKDCIFEHFRMERRHDWGRQEERKEIAAKLRDALNKDGTMLTSTGITLRAAALEKLLEDLA